MLQKANFQRNFDEELTIEYKEYVEVVENHMDQLQMKHCPIVVAGKIDQIN